MDDDILFDQILPEDHSILSDIMIRAFDEDTSLHTDADRGGPNGYDDGTLLELLIAKIGYKNFKIIYRGEIIGAYTFCIVQDNLYSLEMMFIDPILRGEHLGTRVWKEIEEQYTNVEKWITETPNYSIRNNLFYTMKCGFRVIEERVHNNGAKSILYEKVLQ